MEKRQPAITARRFKDEGNLGERLYALRKTRKLSQRKLGDMVRVSHVAISQWESSDSHPSGANLMALCHALDCTPKYLMYGIDPDASVSPRQPASLCIRYPVLSSLQATKWRELFPDVTSAVTEAWIESDTPLYGDGFWLLITNDAMESPIGLSIPEGSYVLFDTVREAMEGDLVMAVFRGRSEPIFRKLVADAGTKYLKALNPAWPVHELDSSYELIGVGVESRQFLIS